MAVCVPCGQKGVGSKTGTSNSQTNKMVTKQITNQAGKIVTIYIKSQ